MGDFENGPSIDSSLDSAFASLSTEQAALIDGEQPVRDAPHALTGDHRDFEAEAKAAAKEARAGKQKGDDTDTGLSKKWKRAGTDQQSRDDAIDKSIAKGQERAAEKAAKADKPNPNDGPKYSAKRHEDDQIRGGIIDRAFQKVGEKPKPFDRKEFRTPESRKLREEIRTRYPGVKLSEIMQRMEGWEQSFKSDPSRTREQIMAAYLQVSPQNFEKPASKKEEQGWDAMFSRGEQDALDLQDLKEYAEKYGGNLPTILRQIVEFDRGMIEDPVGTSARLSANYGAPITAEQHAQHEHKQREQAVQHMNEERLVTGLGRVVESGKLPGIETMWNQIAEALTSGLIRRTGDEGTDLEAAYWHVKSYAGQGNRTDADAKARIKGSKSISGGPSGSDGARKQRDSKSIDKSLDRAFGGV